MNYRKPAPDLPDLDLFPKDLAEEDLDYIIEFELEMRRRAAWEENAREYLAARRRDQIAYHRYNIEQTTRRMAAKADAKRWEERTRATENQWRIEHGYAPLPPPRRK